MVILARIITVLVLFFLLAPVLVVVPMSLSESAFLEFPPPGFATTWYEEFFNDPSWMDALALSARVAIGAMVISVTVGTMAAYALVRSSGRLKGAAQAFLTVPIVIPTIVYAVGAYLIALNIGLLGSELLLMSIHAILALPFVLLNVIASLQTVDRRLELVAQSMGASPFDAFRSVTLPLIAPAIFAGALITVILSLDETVVALFLTDESAPTLPVKIYNSIRYDLNPVVPAAAAVVLGATAAVAAALLAVRWAVMRATGAAAARRRQVDELTTREMGVTT